jgi:DNA-directed RNA polymerase specialized sigma24 family protein
MICLEAMSYQETADVIGINVNHVGVLLHRARTELRTKLQSYAPSPTNAPKKGSKPNATHT